MLVVDCAHSLHDCRCHFAQQSVVAWDCEGVELGRFGSVTVVQLASSERCYVLDLLSAAKEPILNFLRDILEDASVTKIIHDAAADSDALYHLHHIKVVNVHDTQAWHMAIGDLQKRPALNTTLVQFASSHIEGRGDVYKDNYRFWEIRPLTTAMLHRAAEDVIYLFEVYDRQRVHEACAATGVLMSDARLRYMRDASVGCVKLRHVGLFIGKNGANIQTLERLTKCSFHRKRQNSICIIYGETDELVDKACAAVQPYC